MDLLVVTVIVHFGEVHFAVFFAFVCSPAAQY